MSLPSEQPDEPVDGYLPSPVRAGSWVDASGTPWRLRGGKDGTPLKRVAHLMRSTDVPVLLFCGAGAPVEVAAADREALWQRMRPYLRESTPRSPHDHTYFAVAEFKDEQRRSLLIVEESC